MTCHADMPMQNSPWGYGKASWEAKTPFYRPPGGSPFTCTVLKNPLITTALFFSCCCIVSTPGMDFVCLRVCVGLTRKSLFDIFAKSETRFWNLNFRELKFSSESRLMIFQDRQNWTAEQHRRQNMSKRTRTGRTKS